MDKTDFPKDRRRTDSAAADDPILQTLENYWRTLRHADRIPARCDIEPARIDNILPYAFILQRVAPGVARIRVAGQKLHEFFKMDARGMPILSLFHDDIRDDIQQRVEAAFTDPAIVVLPVTSPGNLVQAPIKGMMMFLPLRDNEGGTSRILGALVADGQRSSRPRRFVIGSHARIRHERLELPTPLVALVPPRPLQNTRPNVATRPALRLVVNNA